MTSESGLARAFIFYVATLLFLGVGGITSIGLDWYANLSFPWWTPPVLLVAAVWCVLFFCTALSLSHFWEAPRKNPTFFKRIVGLYMVNALLVLLWNYLFFGIHQVQASFWMAGVIGLVVLLLISSLYRESRTAALLLVPYLLWMLFALCFIYTLARLN